MNKKDAISKIEQLIKEIRKVKATAILGATFSKWRRDTIVALSHIFQGNPRPAEDFKEVVDHIEYLMKSNRSDKTYLEYSKALEKAEVFLQSCIREIDEYWSDKDESINCHKIKPHSSVEMLCSNFHLIAKQLTNRHNNRETIEIRDEYDVQDLLHAILRIFFEDIRPEESTPSYAGKSSRMDFLLNTDFRANNFQ